MNTALIASIRESECQYLSDIELQPFERFVDSFASRFQAYLVLREQSNTLVLQAMRRLIQTKHRRAVQEHGPKCQRDMLYTLQCVARALLENDPDGFGEHYVIWMQNITRALHKEESAVDAYRCLQEEIRATLPQDGATLVNQYLDQLIKAMSSGL